MFYWLILFNLAFLAYFLILFKKQDFNILDIYLFAFWIGGIAYFSANYYFNPVGFNSKTLLESFAFIFLHLLTIFVLRQTLFKKYQLNFLFKNFIIFSLESSIHFSSFSFILSYI